MRHITYWNARINEYFVFHNWSKLQISIGKAEIAKTGTASFFFLLHCFSLFFVFLFFFLPLGEPIVKPFFLLLFFFSFFLCHAYWAEIPCFWSYILSLFFLFNLFSSVGGTKSLLERWWVNCPEAWLALTDEWFGVCIVSLRWRRFWERVEKWMVFGWWVREKCERFL